MTRSAPLAVLTDLGSASREFTVTTTEDLSSISASRLTDYDVIFFALTLGVGRVAAPRT